MEQQAEQMVLRRKARAARAAHEARAMSPARALRLALERCAAGDLGFRLSVTGVEESRALADGLANDLPEHALILLLDGADGVPGVMILDAQLAAALVEAQTMGRVNARRATPRPPTRTDAAIAEPLIEGALRRFAELLEEPPEVIARIRGFRFGAMIDDGTALSLALGTEDYVVMRVGCGLGADREGEITLALPEPPPPATDTPADEGQGAGPAARPLRDRLLNAPARLDAVLCRLSLPLSQTRGLRVGDVLRLPAGVLQDTQLEAAPGRRVARAVLGQMSGQRALRLRGLSARAEIRALANDPAPAAGATDAPESPQVTIDMPAEPPKPAPMDDLPKVDPGEGLPDLSEFGFGDDAGDTQAGLDDLGAMAPAIDFDIMTPGDTPPDEGA